MASAALCAIAAVVARRTGWGLVGAGVAIVAATALSYVVIVRSLASNPPPDALSRALADAIITSIEGGLAHNAILAAASGAALIIIGLVVRVVSRPA